MIDLERLWQSRVILEDGTIWKATSFGAEGSCGGEVVFNTSLSGYQEVLTDPSYHGQVVCMTYPLIGNYGINPADEESDAPQVSGFLVREATRRPSNHRSVESLAAYLQRHGIVALEGLDTRALTKKVRERGAMRIFMSTEALSDDELRKRLAEVPELEGKDYAKAVTCEKPYEFSSGRERSASRPTVLAFDFGAKRNIFRSLEAAGCDVRVMPATTTAAEVLAAKPDGVFLSNGPGDPRALDYAVSTVRDLIGQVPIFGICLGHQILALALGAEVIKMKFGHHGSNHPVREVASGRVEITAQNHGFAVKAGSLDASGAKVSQINLNDNTVAGLTHEEKRLFSVQYHPEASPGPHDSMHLFDRFFAMLAESDLSAAAGRQSS